MKSHPLVSVVFPVLLALGAAVSCAQAPQPASVLPAAAQTKAAKPPWGPIVVIGASASAGFTQSEPLGGPETTQLRLNRYLDAALQLPHEPVRSLANSLFFLQPEAEAQRQITQVLQAKPKLVVGLDFLFWFCYGRGLASTNGLQRFEQGLKLLEAVPCPLILGDIPDASGASRDMLSADQIPSARQMSDANRRLKAWAAARKQVIIVPLSNFMRAAAANQAFTVHGQTFPAGQTSALLQNDRLHPSSLGCAALAIAALDAFVPNQAALSASDVRWDPREVLRLATAPPNGSGE